MNNKGQRLILPINKCRVTASYKNSNYKRQFGFTHYGVDMTSTNHDKRVWASGDGVVTHTGWHPTSGNVVVVIYRECILVDGTVKDLVIRYFHLDRIRVKPKQVVCKDTILAMYGNTGYSSGAHLHIEVDVDTLYPNYTPQTSKSNDVLKSGIDSTINPDRVLYVKTSAPDLQYVVDSGYDTVNTLNYLKI